MRDVAIALHKRGHRVRVFSYERGAIARELETAGVPVYRRASQLRGAPDLIHAHHDLPTAELMSLFPESRAVFVTHNASALMDHPPPLRRIREFLAVDEACEEAVRGSPAVRGWPSDLEPPAISIIPNGVDLQRFQPRGALPERPERALLFSNYANAETHLSAVQEGCRRASLPLDLIGDGVGRSHPNPEQELAKYDIVFAKGRCALEALAVGCAVVVCDARGLGPMVTASEMTRLRRANFGRKLLTAPVTSEAIAQRILAYNATDANEAASWVRSQSDLNTVVDSLEQVYRRVLSGPPVTRDEVDADSRRLQEILRRNRWRLAKARIAGTPVLGPAILATARSLNLVQSEATE